MAIMIEDKINSCEKRYAQQMQECDKNIACLGDEFLNIAKSYVCEALEHGDYYKQKTPNTYVVYTKVNLPINNHTSCSKLATIFSYNVSPDVSSAFRDEIENKYGIVLNYAKVGTIEKLWSAINDRKLLPFLILPFFWPVFIADEIVYWKNKKRGYFETYLKVCFTKKPAALGIPITAK